MHAAEIGVICDILLKQIKDKNMSKQSLSQLLVLGENLKLFSSFATSELRLILQQEEKVSIEELINVAKVMHIILTSSADQTQLNRELANS